MIKKNKKNNKNNNNFELNCLDLLVDLFVNKLATRIFHIHSRPNLLSHFDNKKVITF